MIIICQRKFNGYKMNTITYNTIIEITINRLIEINKQEYIRFSKNRKQKILQNYGTYVRNQIQDELLLNA